MDDFTAATTPDRLYAKSNAHAEPEFAVLPDRAPSFRLYATIAAAFVWSYSVE
jgi:hypothetical protein